MNGVADLKKSEHDIIIVGAGIAGSALASVLGRDGRKVLLIERDLSEPDRIVGELLQPAGVQALTKLGLEHTLTGMQEIPVHGYNVIFRGVECHIPYPKLKDGTRAEGRSFHHGRFVMNLRRAAMKEPNVTIVEATANELIRCETSDAVIGVECTPKVKNGENPHPIQYYAPLTIICDGCFSKFRKDLIQKPVLSKSNFVGFVIKDCPLPKPQHGHVVLSKPGPVLLYQIGPNETRILIDIPGKLPSASSGALKEHLISVVAPQLPPSVRDKFLAHVETERIRSMPNSWLPPSINSHPGVLLLGDAMNMRHPLTGGGMSCAFNDVVLLRELLAGVSLDDRATVLAQAQVWHWRRKLHNCVINVLAQALYDLFSANDNATMRVLQEGCFDYLNQGPGPYQDGPVGALSGLNPSPLNLVYHFFCVAFHGIRLMFRQVEWSEVPATFVRAGAALWTACVVILPVLFSETKW
ncbi:uncharacterized protein VTP21DRAFT_11694 [Calcarisporiella thermophila]|uniref:uncharacterized protein n=1 Tax=Calcarisporiella thermophila TaxID=911321 RepID=UPI0037431748